MGLEGGGTSVSFSQLVEAYLDMGSDAPGSSILKLSQVLHHLSCEILIRLPPCPGYETENLTSWHPL